jgi:putative transcriptional regulator
MSERALQDVLRQRLTSAYAAAALSPALALLVETQAALCPEVARDIATADAAGGAFLEADASIALAPEALENTFARIAALDAERHATSVLVGPHADELASLPQPLRLHAGRALAQSGWRFAAPGIRSLQLDVPGDSKAEILRIEPGAAAPEHAHEGEEFTLVLTGAFHDSRGVYRVGDIAHADPSVTHRPTGDPGPICYSLAVTDAPLRFKGALGLVQKIWNH